MQDGRSRVTVVGARKRVDVAVPSSSPVGEYAPGLADLCGQDSQPHQPAAWSLALAGGEPLPPGASLAEVGVTDGQVLYLRDITRDPTLAPVVEDVDELVLDEAHRLGRAGRNRGLPVTLAGLAWLTGAAVFFAVSPRSAPLTAAACLTVAALMLLTTAWAFQVRGVHLPPGLPLVLSLGSVPCLAVAGALLAYSIGGPGIAWGGAVAGANAATALTLAATPEAVVFALELQLALAAILVPVLTVIQANLVQAAAAVAVCALALIATSKPIAATIAVYIRRSRRPAATMRQEVTGWLVKTRWVLSVIVLGPVIALAITLPILAQSGQPFAIGLALLVVIALLVRARQSVIWLEAALLGLAGLVGAFGLLTVPVQRWAGGATAAMVVIGLGLLLITVGAMVMVGHNPDEPPEEVGDMNGPPRRRFFDVLGTACAVLSAPAALGALGVLDVLVNAGRDIIR